MRVHKSQLVRACHSDAVLPRFSSFRFTSAARRGLARGTSERIVCWSVGHSDRLCADGHSAKLSPPKIAYSAHYA